MPCYTISTVEIDAGRLQLDHAATALEAMGLRPRLSGQVLYHDQGSYNRSTGIATWKGQDRTAELKREYALAGVQAQARRNGWQLRQKAGQDRFAFQIIKR
jgi:hypothetical protein